MPIDWSPLLELVRRHHRFLLTTHIRPDGDALGSMLGFADVLRGLGKDVRTVVASNVAARYHFLDTAGRIEYFEAPGDAWRNTDVAVVLDTSAWSQLGAFGPFLRNLTVPKLVIDHHQTQDDLGAVRLVDATAEATGRLVFEAAGALGATLTPDTANALFVAVAMDTGWFRHSNTTGATFALAAQLVEAGAQPERLYELLFERNSLARLKLMGLVLDRLQLTGGGRVAYAELLRSDYEQTGATPMDSEDLVTYTRSVQGVEVGVFFMEQPRSGIKVSFRSREGIDVARIAERFGGGGHRQAAGVVLTSSLEDVRTRVLQAVLSALPPSS
jgi:bifunctional oligoribonuclease and PAP phosphatase NrnA